VFLRGRHYIFKYYLDELRIFESLNRVFVVYDNIEQQNKLLQSAVFYLFYFIFKLGHTTLI
jgi:hypothetical protein